MPIETSESLVTVKLRSDHQLLQDLNVAPINDFVDAPKLLLAAGRIIVWTRYQNIRTLENSGTVAVYWKLGSLPAADSFGGVLKACTANDDGTGGFIDLSRVPGDVYIAPVTGSTCRVVANTSCGVEGVGV